MSERMEAKNEPVCKHCNRKIRPFWNKKGWEHIDGLLFCDDTATRFAEPVSQPIPSQPNEVQRLKEALQASIEQRESLCRQLEEAETNLNNALRRAEPVESHPIPQPCEHKVMTNFCVICGVGPLKPTPAAHPLASAPSSAESAAEAYERGQLVMRDRIISSANLWNYFPVDANNFKKLTPAPYEAPHE
jgi:hypothetical protein